MEAHQSAVHAGETMLAIACVQVRASSRMQGDVQWRLAARPPHILQTMPANSDCAPRLSGVGQGNACR